MKRNVVDETSSSWGSVGVRCVAAVPESKPSAPVSPVCVGLDGGTPTIPVGTFSISATNDLLVVERMLVCPGAHQRQPCALALDEARPPTTKAVADPSIFLKSFPPVT